MLCRSHSESASHFWQPEEFENVANPYFKHLKHMQNPGHLSLTAPNKCRNLSMGLSGNLFCVLFHFNDIHLIIIPWPGYVSLVGYWFSHLNHLLVGMYNLPLQLWLFPDNLSDNNVIEKLITGSCSGYFLSTDLALFLTCHTMYWARVILHIIALEVMDTLNCMCWGV